MTKLPQSTHTYFFELGRDPNISHAEIRARLRTSHIDAAITYRDDTYICIHTETPLAPEHLMNMLGGTRAIGEAVHIAASSIESLIVTYLTETVPEGKMTFSLHGQHAKKTAMSVKNTLKAAGRSVRYIEPHNTATILHNHLIEDGTDLRIIAGDVYVTRAIQPIEDLSSRDYDRPGRDAKSGMLPPKLAKILINLAEVAEHATLLDPFCGSGTIITEAMLMGYRHIVGTDLSETAVADSKKNVAWMHATYPNTMHTQPHIFVSDARTLSMKTIGKAIDAVVTEPYLGPPLRGTESRKFLIDRAQELKTLYTHVLGSLKTILARSGTIVMVVPAFRSGPDWIDIDLHDAAQELGFSIVPLHDASDILLYAREHHHVGRYIWKFVRA